VLIFCLPEEFRNRDSFVLKAYCVKTDYVDFYSARRGNLYGRLQKTPELNGNLPDQQGKRALYTFEKNIVDRCGMNGFEFGIGEEGRFWNRKRIYEEKGGNDC